MIDALIVSNVILWGVVIAMGVIILALVRQIGVLYERVAPAGALMLNRALKAGDAAPEMEVTAMDGAALHLGGASGTGRSTLLFFLGPKCPVCKSLLPVIQSAARNERAWLDVILASDGPLDEHGEFISAQGLEKFRYVISGELGRRYGVGKLPYAVLIDGAGIVSALGIINSREHLESLFEAKERGVASIQEYLDKRAVEK